MGDSPKENLVSGAVIDAAYRVHGTLGPGLMESVYETCLAHELTQRGHLVARQVPIAIRYRELLFDIGFRADLVVDDLVIVELKSVEFLLPVHKKQTLTYVRQAGKRLGLLLNFGAERIKHGIARLANGLPDSS
ncbi:MAG: GxxExxY protein [Deltaproteobacteria bacterium]|nr:GxxExxY protein [Deltaproteobacteria bacterium]